MSVYCGTPAPHGGLSLTDTSSLFQLVSISVSHLQLILFSHVNDRYKYTVANLE